jgi:hypothetical protein
MPISDGTTLESEQDIVSAFEELFKDKDAETPSEEESDEGKPEAKEAEENEEASDDEANDETEDAEDEPSEDDEGDEGETEDDDADAKKITKKYADDEGTYVKVKVGDEEHEVPVKDLKRLFGQEASLTKKSQEVAAKAQLAEANSAKALTALDVMVKRAQEAAKPYREINWAGLMKDPNVSAEVVQALQAEAKAALDNETFLTGQMDAFMQHIRQQQAETQRTAAAEAIKSLTTEGSPNYVKGWNNDLYNGIREFAVSQGLSRDMVNQLTDPAAFKMLHMAMQFHKGSQKVVTKKVNKSPKKIVKSSTSSAAPSKAGTQLVKRKDALAKQKKAGGNMASTVDAFEALLNAHGDD